MDPKEIKTLKIIEALENNSTHSQRELAKKLDISLGLVNSLIHRVVRKGYIKIATLNKSRLKYRLTPKGITEKSILTYRYILHSIYHYNYIREKLCTLIEALSIADKKDIVLYGANELAEIASILLQEYKLNLIAIVDDLKAGKKIIGMTIVASSYLKENHFDALIMTQLDGLQQTSPKATIDEIMRHGVQKNRIFWI